MTLMLLPGAAVAQDAPTPDARGLDRVCPPSAEDQVDGADFPDATGVHGDAIDCAADYGLVQGFDDGTYRPGTLVNRGQMATFIRNWTETALGISLTVPDEPAFPDIEGTTHEEAISVLAESGIVAGRDDGSYGPGGTVNRAQLARFILNALDYADNPNVTGTVRAVSDTEYFSDVVGSFAQADVQALASVGIVQGTEEGVYSPAQQVNRAQLASFLMRSADFMEREQRWEPTAVVVEYTVSLAGENEVEVDEGTGEVPFGVGEVGATGEAVLTINAFAGTLDFDVDYANVTGPFGEAPGVHIHEGDLDQNGGIVAFLATGEDVEAEDDQMLAGSFVEADVDPEVDFRLADLVFEPEAYYVNLHSDAFEGGAVRGQLPDGGQDLIPSVVTFSATLTGENEVGDQGELGASAEAQVTVDALRGEIAWEIDFSDVTGPFDAAGFHIHAGSEAENGPVVVFFASDAEVEAAEGHLLSGTFTEADLDAESELDFRELLETPEDFYLNLHSEDFPGGAVRAQLG